jgi:hypothetical protein
MPAHTHGVTDPGHSHPIGPAGAIDQVGQVARLDPNATRGVTCTNGVRN